VCGQVARLVVLGCFFLVGLLLRLESLAGRAIWYDEAYSIWASSQPLARIVQESAMNDPHPPGYYLLLSAWSSLTGSGLMTARALSLVFWVVSAALTYRVASEWFGPDTGAGTVCLLSLHAFQVIAAAEARMYMPLEALGLVATWLLWRATRPQAPSGRWLAYGLSVAALAYVSYYSVFLLAGHGVWLAATGGRRHAKGAALAGAAALLAYLPWLPFLPGSVTSNTVPWRPPPDSGWAVALLMTQSYGGHFRGVAGYYGGRSPGPVEAVVGIAPLALSAVGFLVSRKKCAEAAFLVGSSWAVPVAVAAAVSLALGKIAAYPYHLTYVQPYLAVLTSAAVERAWRPGTPGRAVALLGAVAVVAYAAAGADAAWRDLRYQPFRYDLAAGYLRRLYRPGDAVAYAPQGLRRVMHYYYQPQADELQLYVDPRRRDASRKAAEAVRGFLGRRPSRLWVVLTPPLPPDLPELVGQEVVGAGYVRGPTAVFGAVRVDLFVRRVP
ncbi:MAG: glycosyltransferase family 39 protein, partial [Armatimonadota bacterium]|nr:glycosyltransferase family 39 protein [Armatimonadota bacterium]